MTLIILAIIFVYVNASLYFIVLVCYCVQLQLTSYIAMCWHTVFSVFLQSARKNDPVDINFQIIITINQLPPACIGGKEEIKKCSGAYSSFNIYSFCKVALKIGQLYYIPLNMVRVIQTLQWQNYSILVVVSEDGSCMGSITSLKL